MYLILSALVLAADPSLEEQFSEKSQGLSVEVNIEESNQLGSKAIAHIRSDYEKGQYKSMLEELQISYNGVRENDGLKNLAEMRLGEIGGQKKWEELSKKLMEKRNQELVQTVSSMDSNLAKKVAFATASLDPKVEEALFLMQRLHTLQPGQGANADENALIDIDFEYEYKTLHLDLPSLMGKKGDNLRDKQIVLQMEKIDRMWQASQNFEDVKLKAAIEEIHSHLDALLAQNWDMSDLHALVRTAKTADEEIIASILTNYREQLIALSQTILDESASSE